MATLVKVDFYKKTYSPCPHCDLMKDVLDSWIDEAEGVNVEVNAYSVEDNLGTLKERFGPLYAAPVIIVTRNGEENVVTGNNPDMLIDFLLGLDSVWE